MNVQTQWFTRSEILLVKLVQPKKYLYYLKSHRLKDDALVAQTWQLISDEMCKEGYNYTAQECEKKWSLLRIKYGRIRKRTLKEQADTGEFCDPRQKWEIYDAISFLDNYITNRKRLYRDSTRNCDDDMMCAEEASLISLDVWPHRSPSPDVIIEEQQPIKQDLGCLPPSISISVVPHQNVNLSASSSEMTASSFCNVVTSSRKISEMDETSTNSFARNDGEVSSNSSRQTPTNMASECRDEVGIEEVNHLLLSLAPEIRRIKREHQLDFKIDLLNLVKNYRDMT